MQSKFDIKFVNMNIQFNNIFRKEFWAQGCAGPWMQRLWTGRPDWTLFRGFYYLIQVPVDLGE